MLISMKKCYYALMVMLMALVSVGLAACGDDEPKVADIVGTWQYYEPAMYNDASLMFQFTKDGRFHQVVVFIVSAGKTDHFAFHGSYTVKGNNLSMTYDNDDGYDGENETLTCEYMVQGDRLTLLDQDHSTYIRVKDSVIEPYL